jgi:purine-nucleoside phosphorylase
VYPSSKDTADYIFAHCRLRPVLGFILGSGLGAYADSFDARTVLPFSDLPHFPRATAPGHHGNLVIGYAEGVPSVALQGRIHLYEGYSIGQVAFPIKVLRLLGIRRLIVTSSSGGINESYIPGDLMLITDHLNLMGTNPLVGPNDEDAGPRFPDMSEAYDSGMRSVAVEAARKLGIVLHEGVYAGLQGPSYETPAEIRMLRRLGADAVGMSTVPEVIAANHAGIKVLGLSCIANMAAGILPWKLTHKDVMATAERAGEKFRMLLQKIAACLR